MKNNTEFERVLHERVKWIAANIGCTEEEARIIVDLKLSTVAEAKQVMGLNKDTPVDVSESVATTTTQPAPKPKAEKKSKISEDDLTGLVDVIKEHIGDKTFANKDLAPHLDSLGLTARQTPSRLKRLVEMGILSDEGGSPKKYKLV